MCQSLVPHPFYRWTTEHTNIKSPQWAAWIGMQAVRLQSPHLSPLNAAAPALNEVRAMVPQNMFFLPLTQGPCFCCTLSLEGCSVTSFHLFKGHFLTEPLPDSLFSLPCFIILFRTSSFLLCNYLFVLLLL